jgi:hypothetical protein
MIKLLDLQKMGSNFMVKFFKLMINIQNSDNPSKITKIFADL